ncbi:hypothetical protein CK203_099385 [Vitis vinifera]|uniref:Uncharacterized protein n=1 Tax=Vitis vinifera TaxID=29760 RepID=A0A438CHN7_VITVI|nr:hypothetical protein CK203_099385 [Vitis vinifera]
MTPREFFYPRVAMDFYQSMTTQGAQSPTVINFSIDGIKEWSPISQRDMVRILSKRTSGDLVLLCKELPSGMLLEKVHRKKLQRADTIPLLFLRMLCHILEHMGYPTEPHLERRHHYQELSSHNRTSFPRSLYPPALAAPPMPEATSTALPTTPAIPPIAPSISKASITISATKFYVMVHLFQTLTITHNALFLQMADIRAQQDQHTTILCQIQQHLGLLPPPQPNIPGPSESIAPAEEAIPAEETTKADVLIQPTHEATTNPSSPPDTYYISRHYYLF